MPAIRSLICAFILSVVLPVTALACEACLTRSSMEQTVRQADAVLLVVNEDRSSMSADYSNHPEMLDLRIIKQYKGDVDTTSVLVRSWYGMCAYGVQMKLNAKALLFLQESRDIYTGQFDGTYKLVEDGCSEGQLEVRGDRVRLGEEWQSLSSFAYKYLGVW